MLLNASLLTFGLGALAPGDPAQIRLQQEIGEPPTDEQLERARREMGLDRPLAVQYVDWLWHASRGDLGHSWMSDVPVARALLERLPATAMLGAAAAALSILIAIPVGVVSAYRRNSYTDHLARVGALLCASVPNFVMAYILILAFAVMLRLLPVFGAGSPAHIILPAVTLALGVSATLTRLTRSAMLEVLSEDYIMTARARGVSRTSLLARHALKNASIPVITAGGLVFAGLLNGTFIVEWVFAWPGLGKLAIDAIHARDYPLIQGFVLLSAALYVLVNLLVDVLYGLLDPRIRSARG